MALTSRSGASTSGSRQIVSPDATSYAVSGQPVYRVWPSGLSASHW